MMHDDGIQSVSLQIIEGKEFESKLATSSRIRVLYASGGDGSWRIGNAANDQAGGTFLGYCPAGLPMSWRFSGDRLVGMELAFDSRCFPPTMLRLPEMAAVANLLEEGLCGLIFEKLDRERLEARLRSVSRAAGALRLARLYAAMELISSYRRRQVFGNQRPISMRSARMASQLRAAMDYMEERFTEPLDRESVARAIGMEGAAFSRFFHREAGVAFSDYLAVLRTRRAAQLLTTRRDLDLPEVSRRSGFGTLSTFHQQFRKRLGTTPAAFRKAANAEVQAP